jgi:hypothetical protein
VPTNGGMVVVCTGRTAAVAAAAAAAAAAAPTLAICSQAAIHPPLLFTINWLAEGKTITIRKTGFQDFFDIILCLILEFFVILRFRVLTIYIYKRKNIYNIIFLLKVKN